MEGQSVPSKNLKFIESKVKLKAANSIGNSQQNLITAANNHGWIIYSEGNTVKGIPLNSLLDFNPSSKSAIRDVQQIVFFLNLSFRPTLLTVSRRGYSSILMIAGVNDVSRCPIVEFYDLDTKEPIGRVEMPEFSGAEILDYAWHPVHHESLVALCANNGCLLVISINKSTRTTVLAYRNDNYGALTCCWSPKGKNLAIGMASGRMMRLELMMSNDNFTLQDVDKSMITFTHPHITPEHQLVKLIWINKTFLMSVHAKMNGTDTIHSILTVKQGKPYLYWMNVCFENVQASGKQVIYLLDLTNFVVCTSSLASEVGVIGLIQGSPSESSDLNHWSALIVDEEGARIELPLDASNAETYPKGTCIGYIGSSNQPVLLFYTSAGLICSYVAVDSDQQLQQLQQMQLQQPQIQQSQIQPPQVQQQQIQQPQVQFSQLHQPQQTIQQPKPLSFQELSQQQSSLPQSQQQQQQIKPQQLATTTKASSALKATPKPSTAAAFKDASKELSKLKEKIKYNQVFLTTLEQIHDMRDQLCEIQEVHNMHMEALNAVNNEIDSLDLQIKESIFLIEYSESREKHPSKRKPLEILEGKLETMKKRAKQIADTIKDLNLNVDVTWKAPKLNSLEIIYKTIATNQKIINVLKRRAALEQKSEPQGQITSYQAPKLRQNDLTKFKTFLDARCTVPVRKPLMNLLRS